MSASPDLYIARMAIWGANATLIPFGAPIGSIPGGLAGENAARTTVRTYPGASGLDATFTYVAAIPSWVKQPYELKNRHRTPVIRPTGISNEVATAPDADYWSFNNNPGVNTDKSFSGGWIWKGAAVSGDSSVFSRLNVDEYYISSMEGAAKVNVVLRDLSATSATSRRVQDVAYNLNVFHTFVVTYDGGGGATAANGIVIYMDGIAVASTPTNNASYVAMENGAGVSMLFKRTAATGYHAGEFAGGPFGVIVAPGTVLTAEQVWQDTQLWNQYGRAGGFTAYRRMGRA